MRLIAGLLAAMTVAAVAWRARALTADGAVAAAAVGTASVAAGWSWGALLMAFFLSSTALSRVGASRKSARTSGCAAKGDRRDAAQVLANGGCFAVCAAAAIIHPWPGWSFLGLGALAAATADTWATEIGTLAERTPRSILSWRAVPHGTSGGVTMIGTLAALAGGAFLGGLARAVGWPPGSVLAATAGGIGGATADSLLGASLQSRRQCPACGTSTEQTVHMCGASTVALGGIPWMNNDAVNWLGGAVGAGLTLALLGA